ncbi:lysine--tRNA ligase [Devosia rhodophyticola]|uniref:Lysine--tRNA ligase n=1 Tax=Devosia rhodophyticola TaxID=3026423 RepID=A0ABY7Z0Y5_9HYPH|nr:lysine--tRNA ligase [Devosia rhodophyticola]WDR07062.1 lysine--tRNA ligase [Devosia rhodophyticola]
MSPAPLPVLDPAFFEPAQTARAWPFEEAKKLVARLEKTGKSEVLFETGYGPSGLPHIGTFGEVARTTMVRTAFRLLTRDQIPTRLLAFSDDMDGFRKVPGNVPNQEMMATFLGKPLTRVPDPFSNEYPSFGAANNARLRAFLDGFGFSYEFASSTDYYTNGTFDEALLRMLAVYDDVMNIMLPSLGPDRRATYSPFLPISRVNGNVLQVPMVEINAKAGTIVYIDPADDQKYETNVTGGAVKCQWKPDWALRWFALGVDYEMAGKDLIDSVKLANRIVTALGGKPPEGFNYELFLDESGQKISKSKGNGLTIDEWLAYASPQSLGQYMFGKPRAAKRLHFDVIPKAVDDYYTFVAKYQQQSVSERLENPVFHVHFGNPPAAESPLTFALLLNLVSTANAEDASVLWGFISRYVKGATPKTHPELDRLAGYAVRYFNDKVKPGKIYRVPTDKERAALSDLSTALVAKSGSIDADDLQNLVFEIGKKHEFEPLRDWFKAIYQVLLGQDQGPRFGSFIALYGVDETRKLIETALAGDLVKAA